MTVFRSVEEVESRQTAIIARLQEINEEHRGAAFSDEIKEEWNRLNQERDDNDKLIVELRAREAVVANLAGDEHAIDRGAGFNAPRKPADIYDLLEVRKRSRNRDEESAMLLDHAQRAVDATVFPHPEADEDRCKQTLSRLLERSRQSEDDDFDNAVLARRILETGSPTYKRAFSKACIGKALNPDETRALGITGSAGGFAVPFSLDPTIIPTSNLSVNPFRAIADVIQITGTTWQGVSSAGVTAAYAGQGVESTDQAPVLAQPQAAPVKAHVAVPFSIEIGGDWGNLQSEVAVLIQDAKDDLEASKFTSGSGVADTEPQGILTGATTVVTTAGSSAFALVDFPAVEQALGPRFRPRAQWVANRAFYNVARFLDTTGGSGLWLQMAPLGVGLQNNVPRPGNIGAELLGYPANEDSAMTSAVTTQNSLVAVLGDFRYFKIIDRVGMNVEVVPHLFGASNRLPTGTRALYAYWRNTSLVVSANAFRVAKIK